MIFDKYIKCPSCGKPKSEWRDTSLYDKMDWNPYCCYDCACDESRTRWDELDRKYG
jgi:hypothetical protein